MPKDDRPRYIEVADQKRDKQLWRLLADPTFGTRMEAADTAPVFIGIAEGDAPDPQHAALWNLLFEVHPEWRPWYEELRTEAKAMFDELNAEPEIDKNDLVSDEEAKRLLGF